MSNPMPLAQHVDAADRGEPRAGLFGDEAFDAHRAVERRRPARNSIVVNGTSAAVRSESIETSRMLIDMPTVGPQFSSRPSANTPLALALVLPMRKPASAIVKRAAAGSQSMRMMLEAIGKRSSWTRRSMPVMSMSNWPSTSLPVVAVEADVDRDRAGADRSRRSASSSLMKGTNGGEVEVGDARARAAPCHPPRPSARRCPA